MKSTLDPKLDIVFKLLFGAERNRALLISLLSAVLRPASPIETVTALHPEPGREDIGSKAIALDLRVELAGGEQVDIEMQSQPRPALRERALYYWARMYAGQLGRGEHYDQLRRCAVILITDFKELAGQRFHSIFRVLEVHDHEALPGHLELHLVELPKLRQAVQKNEERALVLWATFLSATSDEELEALAMEDPVLKQAKDALDWLSADPRARMLAEQREMAIISQRLDMAKVKAEGEAHGRAEGEAHGRAISLLMVLHARGVAVSDEQRRRIEACTELPALDRWLLRAMTANDAAQLFA